LVSNRTEQLLLQRDVTMFMYHFCFQAEDGIRDRNVTGVQTCALPIYFTCDPSPLRSAESAPLSSGQLSVEYMVRMMAFSRSPSVTGRSGSPESIGRSLSSS